MSIPVVFLEVNLCISFFISVSSAKLKQTFSFTGKDDEQAFFIYNILGFVGLDTFT